MLVLVVLFRKLLSHLVLPNRSRVALCDTFRGGFLEISNIAAGNGGLRDQITTQVSPKPVNNKPSCFRIIIIYVRVLMWTKMKVILFFEF